MHCQSHGLIDNALRSYLTFTTNYKGKMWSGIAGFELEILKKDQENTYEANMTSRAAPTSSWSLRSLQRIRTMFEGRLHAVSCRLEVCAAIERKY